MNQREEGCLKEKFMDWVLEWKKELWAHKYLIIISFCLLTIAIIANFLSGVYTNKVETSRVNDFILDKVPPVNLSIFFVWGFIIMLAFFFFYPLLFNVRIFHKVMSQFSLLIVIRSFFIILTHLKAPIDAIEVTFPRLVDPLQFQNALFFSGHVAIAFLGFLLYRGTKLKGLFFIFTIMMIITVLLMHVHYSIDVFSAIFISYGSYKIGEFLFRKVNHYGGN